MVIIVSQSDEHREIVHLGLVHESHGPLSAPFQTAPDAPTAGKLQTSLRREGRGEDDLTPLPVPVAPQRAMAAHLEADSTAHRVRRHQVSLVGQRRALGERPAGLAFGHLVTFHFGSFL